MNTAAPKAFTQLLDTFTGKPDRGLTADDAHEKRIDAAFEGMRTAKGNDDHERDSFSLFYRLVLARSQIAQVTIELERRKRT